MLFRPSSFRLPGMDPEPVFFFSKPLRRPPFPFFDQSNQINYTLDSPADLVAAAHKLSKNMSGMCHRHRATQYRRPQRAQISLETPCPLFFCLAEGDLQACSFRKRAAGHFPFSSFSLSLSFCTIHKDRECHILSFFFVFCLFCLSTFH